MNTLSSPVYEVKEDSDWYKSEINKKEKQGNFFKFINEQYFKNEGFSYYNSEKFGVLEESFDYEYYKKELLKSPDKHGIYLFRKNSKYYSIFKQLLEELPVDNPFKSHDVLGSNNISGRHWVGNRWFFGVKDESRVEGSEVEVIDYEEYLKVVIDSIKE